MKEAEEIINREISGLEIECKAGCSWCCHQLIIVTCAADGETILETVKERLNEIEFEGFRRMLSEPRFSPQELLPPPPNAIAS